MATKTARTAAVTAKMRREKPGEACEESGRRGEWRSCGVSVASASMITLSPVGDRVLARLYRGREVIGYIALVISLL
jgi:hypothetical protein